MSDSTTKLAINPGDGMSSFKLELPETRGAWIATVAVMLGVIVLFAAIVVPGLKQPSQRYHHSLRH